MNDSRLLLKYFPDLTAAQQEQFNSLYTLYTDWNEKINVISRKDIELLFERHILHSLGIAKIIHFKPNTRILDVGTGGGFPGIPLAIMFPEATFHLVDSIGKKIMVVNEIAGALGLSNVTARQCRAEEIKDKYHFVVSRAVTAFPEFYGWVRNRFSKENFNDLKNGILCLKGGDLSEELQLFPKALQCPLPDFFEESFFETKKVVYLSAGF